MKEIEELKKKNFETQFFINDSKVLENQYYPLKCPLGNKVKGKKLHSTSEDGWDFNDIYEKAVKETSPLLLLAKTTNGAKFGVYTSV